METPTQLDASTTVTATSSGPAAAAPAAIETISGDTLVTATGGGHCGPVGFMPVAYAPAYAYARPVVYAPAYRPVAYAPASWAYAAAPAYGGWWGYRR